MGSWSINPNMAVNCIYLVEADDTLEQFIESFYEQELVAETAVSLEPSLQYGDNDSVLLADWWGMGNGHSRYDLFLAAGDTIYWTVITIGTPGGYTPEQAFEEFGEVAEKILYEMITLNMERSGQ